MTESAGKKKLQILFFSQRFPYPMDTGGKIRTGKLLEQLKKFFDITLVSNVESPKDDAYLAQVKNLCTKFYPVPWKETRKYSFRFYLKLFRSVFSRYPFTVINDYSRDLEAALLYLTASVRFDLLICDFLQPSLNFRRLKGVPTLLFEHNIEAFIPRRHFETSGNPFAKCFWWLQWRRMERYEKRTCHQFTSIVTVSENDKRYLKEVASVQNVFAVPTGIDTHFFAPREGPVKQNSLVFTGSMDWLPNEDGILFFAREILEQIRSAVPGLTVAVVGRNPSSRLIKGLKKYPAINIVGWVDDVRPYISQHAIYIIPLRIGGGTRIKVFEAMSMGKAVVSTSVGIEGLPVKNGEHVVVADSPEEFAKGVVMLLNDRPRRARLETSARQFVRDNFSWEIAAKTFAYECHQVAVGSSPTAKVGGGSLGFSTVR
jgi:glycosyltransferase involved in cell wall biosynthesis